MVEQWQIDRNAILKSIATEIQGLSNEIHNVVEGLSDITQVLQQMKDQTMRRNPNA